MKNFNSNWDGVDRNTTNHLSEASQQVIGKYRFTPFMENTNSEGTAGWTISIQGKGVVAYIAEPKIKSGTSPYKIFRTKGLSFKNFFPGELKMSAYPGTENRVVSEKEIRFVPRQLLKAVVMWMDKYGTKALTEDMENTEMVADEVQSLDEVQFITPKVPLKGGSNSKGKTDNSHYAVLYADLKDTIMLAIKKLEEAESMLRSPSKNSTLSILQTVTQTKQKLKIAVK
jgi:hypothetical protein